ncbi:MAG: hypothetical protein ACON5D_18760 [Rubripirellula sp.]
MRQFGGKDQCNGEEIAIGKSGTAWQDVPQIVKSEQWKHPGVTIDTATFFFICRGGMSDWASNARPAKFQRITSVKCEYHLIRTTKHLPEALKATSLERI